MKAILVNDDRSLRWDNVPDPVMGEEDCLVKIEAAVSTALTLCKERATIRPRPDAPNGWVLRSRVR